MHVKKHTLTFTLEHDDGVFVTYNFESDTPLLSSKRQYLDDPDNGAELANAFKKAIESWAFKFKLKNVQMGKNNEF